MSFLFLSHWGCFIHPPPPQEIQQKSSLINAVVLSFATKMISWGVSFCTSSGRMTIWERGHSTPLITSLEITLDTIRNPPPSLEISSYSAHLILESRILDLNLQKGSSILSIIQWERNIYSCSFTKTFFSPSSNITEPPLFGTSTFLEASTYKHERAMYQMLFEEQ